MFPIQPNQPTAQPPMVPLNQAASNNPYLLSLLNQVTPPSNSQQYNGLCEAFAEHQKFGHTGIYPSAIAAWNAHSNKVQGLAGIQLGDQIFFGADQSNGGYGHTGIYQGNGKFISATYNGVQIADLNSWQKSTGQKLLGYLPE